MIRFGGDYNPEQWPPHVWREDVALMRSAGVSLVTVGVFSWSRLQPAEDRYDFAWLDEVLDLLHGNGIGVCLATPTASPPPWFTRAHPGAMPVTADGVRLTHGSRDTYCVNAPEYQAASNRIASEMAARYGQHPALRLWHVHNEYGTTCYCDHCAPAFRRWLSHTYGEIGSVNEAWCTDFWSQRYGCFDEVLPPRATQYLSNPAHLLDYRRFVSDAMLAHYVAQRDILRPYGVPVTTNFVLGGWVPVDHARWAREVDVVAVDDYPESAEGHLAARAFVADLARGWAGGQPWMLMEHAPGAVREADGVTRALPAGEARAAAETYAAGGASAIMYFQWRAGRGGAEQWHPAMVPLLSELAPIGQSLATRTPARVESTRALIYDEQSMWAWQSPHVPTPFVDYTAIARRWHHAMGPPVDVLPPGAPLEGCSLVVAPVLHMVSGSLHKRLRSYVADGGTLVLTFGSGLTDEHSRTTPGAFDDLCGIRVTRHRPGECGVCSVRADRPGECGVCSVRNDRPGECGVCSVRDDRPGECDARNDRLGEFGGEPKRHRPGECGVWLDEIEPRDATVVLHSCAGRPLVTEHRYGRGLVRYVAADLPDPTPWTRS